jgi:phosphoglycolate phosphatase
MLDAILFDLDGTILDTLEDLRDACNYAITKYGFNEVTKEDVRRNIGNGILMLIKRCVNFNLDNIDLMHQRFKEYYSKNCNVHTKPYKDIYILLDYIKSKKIKMGVVTNKAYYAAKELIDSHFDGYFDLVLGDQMNIGLERKPNPNIIYYAMDKLNVSDKNKVLYIGDSDVDIDTVNNANILGAFVSYGYRDKELLLKKTNHVYDNVSQLLDYVKSLNE